MLVIVRIRVRRLLIACAACLAPHHQISSRSAGSTARLRRPQLPTTVTTATRGSAWATPTSIAIPRTRVLPRRESSRSNGGLSRYLGPVKLKGQESACVGGCTCHHGSNTRVSQCSQQIALVHTRVIRRRLHPHPHPPRPSRLSRSRAPPHTPRSPPRTPRSARQASRRTAP